MSVREFIEHHYRHFNAATLLDAAAAYEAHIDSGGKMLLTMAGAMSTAELGISLAEMIRKDKVHAICCTGANLEEDIYNLVAHNLYKRVPHYRELSAKEEGDLRDKGLNRVTDTCIPEEAAMKVIERHVLGVLQDAEKEGKRLFPYEVIYEVLERGALNEHFQINPKDSWVIAAKEKGLPIFVPGWEDSTLGNGFVSFVRRGLLSQISTVKSGLELMDSVIDWYKEESRGKSIGFFQIGGGIAGDFPICVVPLIQKDMHEDCPYWGYFCQISDSTTSYGSYSGAVPNEKITWSKLDVDTPRFVIESDASIVAPLIFAYILGN